ncbi:MAG: AAA family ATPase, partial [Deltaproteobacteria bacterium]|nr:AAA family ATPase [Deltaproteobacteria bacterium]
LMLKDITIENYRLFEKFHLEGMTQINLLVGTNNSGKSSLLEAIYLLVNSENSIALSEVLSKRFIASSRIHGRSEFTDLVDSFKLSDIFGNYDENQRILISSQQEDPISLEYVYKSSRKNRQYNGNPEVDLKYIGKQKISHSFNLEKLLSPWYKEKNWSKTMDTNKHFVTPDRLDQSTVTRLWEQIVLTPKEEMVLDSLHILEPKLEKMAFTSFNSLEMSVRLKIKGRPNPIPLGSMGDGIYRILALVISLVSCENGVLLVDEIDTGLHYTALTKMWRLVIETAKKLNVQVFAT